MRGRRESGQKRDHLLRENIDSQCEGDGIVRLPSLRGKKKRGNQEEKNGQVFWSKIQLVDTNHQNMVSSRMGWGEGWCPLKRGEEMRREGVHIETWAPALERHRPPNAVRKLERHNNPRLIS